MPSKEYLTEEMLNKVLTFTVDLAPMGEEGPIAKKIKVELRGEPSKNELFATSLREILNVKKLVIDTGNIDETPPIYSPFNRSSSDLFMKSTISRGELLVQLVLRVTVVKVGMRS